MTLSYTTDPSPTAPLACDCLGAVVYIKLLAAHRALTRDGHGVLLGQLSSRSQSADGSWNYTFVVDESGLISPPPAISGGMVQSICCQGCLGYAAEAFNQQEFGGRIVDAAAAVVLGVVAVRHTIRPFLIQDVRAWVTTPAAAEVVTIHVIVDGVQVTVAPIKIPVGAKVSDGSQTFAGGAKNHWVNEGSLIALQVTVTGPAAKGLEAWFFGHLNPSAFA